MNSITRWARSRLILFGLAVLVQAAPLSAQHSIFSLGAGALKIAVLPETARPGDPIAVALAGPGPALGAAAFVSRQTPGEETKVETTAENGADSAQPAVINETADEEAGERPGAILFGTDGKRIGKTVFFSLNKESFFGPVRAAILAIPTTAKPGEALIRAGSDENALAELAFTIESRAFKTETLVLSQTMSDILSVPDPQKTREAEKLWQILSRTGNEVFCPGNFILPVDSQVQTSLFGGRRVYRYPDGRSGTSIHAGVDYRAREGTPITVCAPGRVVFAGPRIVSGNTVIIEHMPGVYSLCYHLSKISLAEGQIVAAGDPLGEAGSTGFSTAAHLHWEIRVAGENTDPEVFMNRTVLDKDALLGKLYQ
jgi:murein DD-endopeptidase MepM/ murein hydrolase activator NlpD